MKSPFPGMDPYIEACGLWEGFHNRLIHKIDEALAQNLPRGYTIDTATRTYIVLIEAESKKQRLAKPDVTITEPAAAKKPRRKKGGVVVADPYSAAESVPMRAFVAEKVEEHCVEIYAEGDER